MNTDPGSVRYVPFHVFARKGGQITNITEFIRITDLNCFNRNAILKFTLDSFWCLRIHLDLAELQEKWLKKCLTAGFQRNFFKILFLNQSLIEPTALCWHCILESKEIIFSLMFSTIQINVWNNVFTNAMEFVCDGSRIRWDKNKMYYPFEKR